MPFLTHITSYPQPLSDGFPFCLKLFSDGFSLKLEKNVTFLVGENGSGKSTILEAIAEKIGFNLSGGNKNHQYEYQQEYSEVASQMRLGWRVKVHEGFFLRAESFYNFATYLDSQAEENGDRVYRAYGGKSLHHQSHGEAFLALFHHKFSEGIFILDEPEAALSPQRQLSLLSIIYALEKVGTAQFIIATHSPILLSYPNADILDVDNALAPIAYKDTHHYQVTKGFLDNPELYFKHLFEKEE